MTEVNYFPAYISTQLDSNLWWYHRIRI